MVAELAWTGSVRTRKLWKWAVHRDPEVMHGTALRFKGLKRVLLDECVDERLRHLFPARTVRSHGAVRAAQG
jgi:hypothetical protein